MPNNAIPRYLLSLRSKKKKSAFEFSHTKSVKQMSEPKTSLTLKVQPKFLLGKVKVPIILLYM